MGKVASWDVSGVVCGGFAGSGIDGLPWEVRAEGAMTVRAFRVRVIGMKWKCTINARGSNV